VCEGEAAHRGVGDGSPGSREAEGEGGEGFYIAQSGRCPDLLVIGGRGEEWQEPACTAGPQNRPSFWGAVERTPFSAAFSQIPREIQVVNNSQIGLRHVRINVARR
jgi:hypothetical protein